MLVHGLEKPAKSTIHGHDEGQVGERQAADDDVAQLAKYSGELPSNHQPAAAARWDYRGRPKIGLCRQQGCVSESRRHTMYNIFDALYM